jgi:hypothetical protein
MYLDAPLRQFVGNDAGGTDFLEADLGMRVQIPADRGEFVGKGFDAVDVGHLIYPMAGEGERDLTAGAKAGPFGLIRMPGRNRVHGNAAVRAKLDSSLRRAQATKQSSPAWRRTVSGLL